MVKVLWNEKKQKLVSKNYPEFLATEVRVFKYDGIKEYRVQIYNGRADRWETVFVTDSCKTADAIATGISNGLRLPKRDMVSGYTEDIAH